MSSVASDDSSKKEKHGIARGKFSSVVTERVPITEEKLGKLVDAGVILKKSAREIAVGRNENDMAKPENRFLVTDITSYCEFPPVLWKGMKNQTRKITVSQGEFEKSLELNQINRYGDACKPYTVAQLGKKSFELPRGIDITDTNKVRYALRHDKEMSDFLDRFVIVKSNEKESYIKYADKVDAKTKEEVGKKKINYKIMGNTLRR